MMQTTAMCSPSFTIDLCFVFVILFFIGWTRIEITHPRVKPVYVNSGGTLNLTCEVDEAFKLQWHRAVYHVDNKTGSTQLGQYHVVDTSSEGGFVMTASITDGRGSTLLTKANVSVNDAGSYKCSRLRQPSTSYAVDVYVLQGWYRLLGISHFS